MAHGRRLINRMTAITYEHTKKTLVSITQVIIFLVMLDIMILFMSLGQIIAERQSGYWNPFWQVQAQAVLSILR
ncbi:MAG: hypothetical protein A2259_01565 [Candidatus Moranbacteria bacterium RIFOXYA2_FULL_43_15]|nr:MAG: hypothetical protein A2259_01565 [Candidatus Moranbacteria bacterium RIFOXYA2_FULL_43_15]